MNKSPRWIEFKPFAKSLTKVLGDLEVTIMEALWKLQASDVKKIHKEVNQKHKVAITTVATVLDRLHEKGLVERELKKARASIMNTVLHLQKHNSKKRSSGRSLKGYLKHLEIQPYHT